MEPAARPPKVSVIVVSFNTKEKLRRCLSCIEPEHEVIVVDNASVDGSPEMVASDFPSARLIANTDNVGFGVANNQGMLVASGDLILLLNSDCYADPGAISTLASVFNDPAVIAAGGKLKNTDGSLQESVAGPLTLGAVFLEQSLVEKLLGRLGLVRGYWRTGPLSEANVPAPVEQVMGACLMMRPVERFDERFFLYVEDTDLCLRLRRHGKILYVPTAEFTHELGSSSSGMNKWLGVARYNVGKELFFAIHKGGAAASACLVMDRLGALLRLALWLIPTVLTLGLAPRFRRQSLLFLRVLTAPLRERRRPPRKPG